MGPQLFLFMIVYICTIIMFSMMLASKMRNVQKGQEALENNAIMLTFVILTPVVNTVLCVLYILSEIFDFLKKNLPGAKFSFSAAVAWYRKWFAKIFM